MAQPHEEPQWVPRGAASFGRILRTSHHDRKTVQATLLADRKLRTSSELLDFLEAPFTRPIPLRQARSCFLVRGYKRRACWTVVIAGPQQLFPTGRKCFAAKALRGTHWWTENFRCRPSRSPTVNRASRVFKEPIQRPPNRASPSATEAHFTRHAAKSLAE